MENLVCGTSVIVETNNLKRIIGTKSISVKKLQ